MRSTSQVSETHFRNSGKNCVQTYSISFSENAQDILKTEDNASIDKNIRIKVYEMCRNNMDVDVFEMWSRMNLVQPLMSLTVYAKDGWSMLQTTSWGKRYRDTAAYYWTCHSWSLESGWQYKNNYRCLYSFSERTFKTLGNKVKGLPPEEPSY